VSNGQPRRITIICPVHNEEAAILCFTTGCRARSRRSSSAFEIELLFSNNGSTDRTLQAIHELRKHDSSVHALSLARDFGYEASVATALRPRPGDAMIVIDVDCEDPPDLIPQFVHEWDQGYDVVYGKRDRRV